MPPHLYCLFTGLLLATGSSLAMATVNPAITLATYDYPPYCDSTDPDGGALVAIVRAAFAEEDISVNLTVLPWQRLSSLSASGRLDGVIGVWKTDTDNLKVSLGPPVFYSLLGYYLHQNRKPLKVSELAGRRAGVGEQCGIPYQRKPLLQCTQLAGRWLAASRHDRRHLLADRHAE